MMACPAWSNVNTRFTYIPPETVAVAVTLLKSRTQELFPYDLSERTLLPALRSRLYFCRERWREKRKEGRIKKPAEAVLDGRLDMTIPQLLVCEQNIEQPPSEEKSSPSLKIVLKVSYPCKQTQQNITDMTDKCVSQGGTTDSSHQQQELFPTPLPPGPKSPPVGLSTFSLDNSCKDKNMDSTERTTSVSTSNPSETCGTSFGDEQPPPHMNPTDAAKDTDTIVVDVTGQKGTVTAASSMESAASNRRHAQYDRRHKQKVCQNRTVVTRVCKLTQCSDGVYTKTRA